MWTFTLGSNFYEIMQGSTPYKRLSREQIYDNFAREIYPDSDSLEPSAGRGAIPELMT